MQVLHGTPFPTVMECGRNVMYIHLNITLQNSSENIGNCVGTFNIHVHYRTAMVKFLKNILPPGYILRLLLEFFLRIAFDYLKIAHNLNIQQYSHYLQHLSTKKLFNLTYIYVLPMLDTFMNQIPQNQCLES